VSVKQRGGWVLGPVEEVILLVVVGDSEERWIEAISSKTAEVGDGDEAN